MVGAPRQPVPATSLPCGNIAPTVGITGTPVIDQARHEIFVGGRRTPQRPPGPRARRARHDVRPPRADQRVDPPGQDPAAILQRTALTLSAGQVVFGFGGNYGDCSTYRGRLVAVPRRRAGRSASLPSTAAADESKGAIWMGGAAPAVDSHGNVWVSTGNGSIHLPRTRRTTTATACSSCHRRSGCCSTSRLSPGRRTTPATSTSRPSPRCSLTGRSSRPARAGGCSCSTARTSAGSAGSRRVAPSACNDDIDGGSAVSGMTVYLPCLSGIIAVRATSSPPSLRLLWRSGTGGGPPILAAGLVWTIGQDGTLYGLDPATGRIRRRRAIGVPANHFPTASVGDGLLLAPCAQERDRVPGAEDRPRRSRELAHRRAASSVRLQRAGTACLQAGDRRLGRDRPGWLGDDRGRRLAVLAAAGAAPR